MKRLLIAVAVAAPMALAGCNVDQASIAAAVQQACGGVVTAVTIADWVTANPTVTSIGEIAQAICAALPKASVRAGAPLKPRAVYFRGRYAGSVVGYRTR